MNTREEAILVVDDDEGVAILQRRTLERRGYRVVVASTMDDALTAIAGQSFDLIVTDYRLGVGTGLELLVKAQALGRTLPPTIVVSGFGDESTVIEAIRCGVRDFVTKSPEYLHYLPDAVERVLKAVDTERELLRSEARFQLFMDNSPAAAFVKNATGGLVYANRAAQRLIGREDWLGKSDAELWPEDTAEQLRRNDLSVLESDQAAELREAITLLSGEVRHFVAYKFPMEDACGQRYLGSMAVDITQQQAAEDAVRQKDDQLRQAQKMEAIGTLAGGIAHEFNNLLQAVLGYTRFAMSSVGEGHQAQDDLKIVVSAAERAAVLTQQLLSFSRREPSQMSPLDVNLIVHEMKAMLQPLLGAQIQIELSLDDEIGMVSADHVQIEQMLMNLCINARDAMPNGGVITISTQDRNIDDVASVPAVPRQGRYVALSVADSGCGMSDDVKQKIFEPFFTTKPIGQGTGLGLSMVYNAVQYHAGGIHLETEPDKGTTFTVYLPLLSVATAQKTSEVRGESGTILIAEDEPLVLDLTKRMLEGAGYRVLAAVNGREAVDLFRQHSSEVDLVVVDAVMPEVSGWEAIREIRNVDSLVAVILTTGYDRHRSQELPVGAAPRFLQKPFALDRLLDYVQEVLRETRQCA